VYKLIGDTIEHRNIGDNIILFKHNKPGTYIRKGTKIRIRKNQSAFIVKDDVLYSVLRPGTYYLLPDVFPELKECFTKGLKSVVDIDLYILNQKPFASKSWSNKEAVSIKDNNLKHVQLRAFGKFSFRIEDAYKFVSEVFVKKKKYFTCNIMVHLSGYVARAVGESMQEAGLGVADIINSYRSLEGTALEKLKTEGQAIGVDFMDVCIDNLSIPMVVQQFFEDKKWKDIESRYK
jgi:membrane protease subunit (stomatin/prohibitin family)